jgi:hypothetical protein
MFDIERIVAAIRKFNYSREFAAMSATVRWIVAIPEK